MRHEPVHWKARFRTKWLPEDDYDVQIVGVYHDGTPVMEIRKNGEPQARVSVCLSEHDLTPPQDHLYVKTWSENEGVLEALIEKGIVERAGGDAAVWPVNHWGSEAILCRILYPQEVIR